MWRQPPSAVLRAKLEARDFLHNRALQFVSRDFAQAGGEYPVGVSLQHTNGLFHGAPKAGGPYGDGARA